MTDSKLVEKFQGNQSQQQPTGRKAPGVTTVREQTQYNQRLPEGQVRLSLRSHCRPVLTAASHSNSHTQDRQAREVLAM